MIILDTNAVSAMMKNPADPVVVSWLNRQAPRNIRTTAITVMEIQFGIAIMPAGRRRAELEARLEIMLAGPFQGRVLAFEQRAARTAALLAARLRLIGKPMEVRDNQIAGVALEHQAVLATRNIRHFREAGLKLIDPWAEGRLD